MRGRHSWLIGCFLPALMGAGIWWGSRGQQAQPQGPPAVPLRPSAVQKAPTPRAPSVARLPLYERWETFTHRNGLPSDHVFCVRMDGQRVWAGTDQGLALYEGGRWRAFTEKDGLPHRVVHSIDISPTTGDVWIATFRGLACYSGGRFTTFTQFNSGLPNNVVYSVVCVEDEVWVATTAGTGRYETRSKRWSIFNEKNSPMHEIWCYNAGKSEDDRKVYIAVWGGGVLEYDRERDHWRDYRDPDGEFEVDVVPNDGLNVDITTGVSQSAGYLWVSSYFGLNRYDHHRWWNYYEVDSGLPSDFINLVKASGPCAWVCTDKGLAVTDGERWAVYRPLPDRRGEVLLYRGKQLVQRRIAPSSIAHRYVLGVDVRGDEVWVATSGGLSHALATAWWQGEKP